MTEIPEVGAAEAHALLTDGALLVDVREQHEWDAGHADGAIHLPLSELEGRVGELPAGRRVVLICRSGARSMNAAKFLGQHGHDTVNLAGGSRAWVAEGLPFVTDGGVPGTVA